MLDQFTAERMTDKQLESRMESIDAAAAKSDGYTTEQWVEANVIIREQNNRYAAECERVGVGIA